MREEYNILLKLFTSLSDVSLRVKQRFDSEEIIQKFFSVLRSCVITDMSLIEIGNLLKKEITESLESDLSRYSDLFTFVGCEGNISLLVVWHDFLVKIDVVCKNVADKEGDYSCHFTSGRKLLWDNLTELYRKISDDIRIAIDMDLITAKKMLQDRYHEVETEMSLIQDELIVNNCYMIGEKKLSFSPDNFYEADSQSANSAVFAPTSVIRGDYCLIQVFIYEEQCFSEICEMAEMADPDAKRRNYMPLNYKILKGDKIKIDVSIAGGDLSIENSVSEQIWNGGFIKHVADFLIPRNYNSSSFIGIVRLYVNDIPVGEMKFRTKVDNIRSRTTWAEVESLKYRSSFISFMSEDLQSILFLAEGFRIQKELNGIDYFFSKHTLKNGDDYPEKIEEYINSCDVFILCWSKNAQKSEWVEKEYNLAVHRYRSRKDIALRIYNIVPKAPLPPILSEQFHIEELG